MAAAAPVGEVDQPTQEDRDFLQFVQQVKSGLLTLSPAADVMETFGDEEDDDDIVMAEIADAMERVEAANALPGPSFAVVAKGSMKEVPSLEAPSGLADINSQQQESFWSDDDLPLALQADAAEKAHSITADEVKPEYAMSGLGSKVIFDGWSHQLLLQIELPEDTSKEFLKCLTLKKLTQEVLREAIEQIRIDTIFKLGLTRIITINPEYKAPTTFELVKRRAIIVNVLAKKKVDVNLNTFVDQTFHTSGQLIISDCSGWCLLSLCGDAVKTIYDQVAIGDILFIDDNCVRYMGDNKSLADCSNSEETKQQKLMGKVEGLFAEDKFRPIEVKANATGTSRFYHQSPSSMIVVPDHLFNKSHRLLSPWNVRERFIPGNKSNFQQFFKGREYFDLFGVVTYCGRLERNAVIPNDGKPQQVRDFLSAKHVPYNRWTLRRWISLGDPHPSQINVKIYVNSLNHEIQHELVPGQLVILTHCKISTEAPFDDPFCTTTHWSEICYGKKLDWYTSIRPKQVYHSHLPTYFSDNLRWYKLAMKSNKVYSAGGTVRPKIRSPVELKHYFEATSGGQPSRAARQAVLESHALVRREVLPNVYFRGKIVAAKQVTQDGRLVSQYPQFNYDDLLLTGGQLQQHAMDPYLIWNWIQFKVPLNFAEVRYNTKSSLLEVVKMVTDVTRPYCEVLLLPSKLQNMEPPLLSGMDKLQENEPLTLVVLERENNQVQELFWINESIPAGEKWEKICELLGKQVCGIGEKVKTTAETPDIRALHDLCQDPEDK